MSNDSLQKQIIDGRLKEKVDAHGLGKLLPGELCGDVSQCPFFAALKPGERCARFHDATDATGGAPVRQQCIGVKRSRF